MAARVFGSSAFQRFDGLIAGIYPARSDRAAKFRFRATDRAVGAGPCHCRRRGRMGLHRPRFEPAGNVAQGQRVSAGAELVPGLHQGHRRVSALFTAAAGARARVSPARRHGRCAVPSPRRNGGRRSATTAAARCRRNRCTMTVPAGRSG